MNLLAIAFPKINTPVVEEYTPGGIIKVSYVYGHDLISQQRGTEQSFYHVDGLGSTRALSDESGVVTDSYIYDAFGQVLKKIGDTENPYLFAGEQRDNNLGLDYLRARYLDVGTGRFVSRDSFEGFLNNPITLHKYLYANANPINFIDPSGKFSLISISVSLSINTNFRANFANAGLNAVRVVRDVSAPLLEAGYRLQEAGLSGIGGAPGAFEIYDLGRRIQVAGLRSVQQAIINIYLDTLRASIPTLNFTVGGFIGRTIRLIQSFDELVTSIIEFSNVDFSNPVDAISKAQAIKDAAESFGSDYEITF